MLYTYFALIIGSALFLSMLALIELGWRIGRRRKGDDAAGARAGLGAIDASVFSLLGLLIAFSFSGAAARFDARRHLSVQEANCIGTAWLRLDLVAPDQQSKLRSLFRDYVDARLGIVQRMPDLHAVQAELRRCGELQNAIWTNSVTASVEAPLPQSAMLLLPALNQMFDIASTRNASARIHPPGIIFAVLIALSLASALLVGHEMGGTEKKFWIHRVGLAAAVAVANFVILDLEFPRIGMIRLDAADQFIIDVRQTMSE